MAASVIDQLIVQLNLDPSKFKKAVSAVIDDQKKLKQSSQAASQDVEKSFDKTTDSVSKLRGEVLSLFAVFTAGRGIKEFISSVVQTDLGLGRMAYTLDTTVQKLGKWAGAGAMVGASAQDILGSFQSMTSQFQLFALTGESSVLPFFRALGVDISDGNGHMRDMGEVFLDLADKFHNMDPARAKAFGDQMGLSPGMINLLIQGRAAVEGYLTTAKKYAPTDRDVQVAYNMTQQWNQMTMASTKMGRSFLTDLAPGLGSVMEKLTGMADFLSAHPDMLNKVMTGLTGVIGLLSLPLVVGSGKILFGGLAGGMKIVMAILPRMFLQLAMLTRFLPSVSEAFFVTGAAIEGSIAPILLMTLAIAGVIYEIKQLITDTDSAARHAARLQYEHDRAKAPRGDWRRDPLNATYREDGHYERDAKGVARFVKNKPGAPGASGAHGGPAGPGSNGLADLIGSGEGGYNSVNLGLAGGYKSSSRDLEKMTVAEVMAAQARHEFNAAGKYQVIADTLAGAAKNMNLSGSEKFDKSMQDKIFGYLINVKRPEIGAYLSGKSNDRHAAQLGASLEWASVANPDTGLSSYASDGHNSASISASQLGEALDRGRARAARAPAQDNFPGLSLPGAAQQAGIGRGGLNSSTELHIGELNIHTQATDATGIARELPGALNRQLTSQQANYGPR